MNASLTHSARLQMYSRILGFFLALSCACYAQIPSRTDTTSTPVPNSGHDYIHAPVETVNPANGSLSIRIGVPMPPGRDLTLPFNFAYDSNGEFYLTSPNVNGISWDTAKTLISQGGWSYSAPVLSLQKTKYYGEDDIGNQVTCYALINFVMEDPSGNTHNLGLSYFSPNTYCNMGQEDGPVTTAQIGPMIAQTTNNWPGVSPVTVTDGDGTVYQFPYHSTQPEVGSCLAPCQPTAYTATTVTDRNGNTYGYQSAYGGPALVIGDSIGRTAVNIPTFGSNPDSVTVSGLNNPYYVYWTTVQANYGVNFTHVNDGSYTCNTASGGQPSINAVSQIVLPNGQAFNFSYDPTYGTVNKITYPSGGYVRYVWGLNPQSQLFSGSAEPVAGTFGTCDYYYDNSAIVHRFVSFDGVHEVLQQDFSYSTSWGISGNPYDFWSQKTTTITTTDLVRNTQYSTVYIYSPTGTDYQPNVGGFAPQIPAENTIKYFKDTNTSGTPIRVVTKTWANERMLTKQQTVLDNGELSESDWTYNTNEMETDRKDYDYGSPGPGGILRETVIPSYHSFSNHIVDKPDSVKVTDGSSQSPTVYAGANYQYDGNGNVLDRYDWLNQTGSSYLQTSHTYDPNNGNMISTTDPANNTTTYSYTDSWVATCSGVSNSNAYLTSITYPTTNGVQHIENFAYNCPTGDLASSTDQNGNTTSYQYNDPLSRLKEIDYPTGWGKSTTTYTDTPGSLSIETKRIDSNGITWADSVDLFDGLFHTTAHSAANGESTPWNRVDTCYDGNGLTMFSSYPYQISSPTTAPNCSGTGDSMIYDVLGRATSITHSDGSAVATAYTGRATDVQDEGNGTRAVERISQIDGLGRLQYVCEITGQAQQGVSPSNCGLDYSGSGFLTSYGYNQRGDLTSVNQSGLGRSFNYDMQSRLISAINPESGTLSYNYDSDTNCPQQYYSGELISRVDARSIRTCMTYDALHRLTGKSYIGGSPATPSVTYNYDQSSVYGRSLTNTVGRKSSESTADPTGSVFSYDALGHVIDNSQCTPQDCSSGTAFPVTYGTYTVLGSPSSETNGVGVTTNYGYNSAGALYSVTSSISDGNHPGTLLNNVHYNAFGSPVSSSIGALPLTDGRGYTTRGWLQSESVGGPSTQSSGSVTISGSEGSRQNTPAVAGTGSVTISGSEQSTTVQTSGGSRSGVAIQVSGSEQSFCTGECLRYTYDTGTVSITVNGCTTSTTYGKTSTANNVASSLYSGFSCGTVTASLSGATITFTSVAYGSSTNNYAWSTNAHSNYQSELGGPSFAAVPPGWGLIEPASGYMSGGSDPTYTTVYDSGTATVTANGHGDSYSWGSGASTSSVASGLASAINNDGGAAVSANASGSVVYLTARTVGSGTNYSFSASTNWNTSYFGSPSFAFSDSAGTLTGGVDATYTYDSGTVTITANGTGSSASYGQGSTNATVASALASAVNANNGAVSASASGNVVTLTSRSGGAYTNYSLSASSSGSFNPPSFTTSASGGSMTGGTGNTLYSLGVNYYNNGDVQTASDNVNGNWNYSYDDFNRLNTAVAANISEGCIESYDQYGNRWSQEPYGGSGYSCNSWTQSFTGNNNRINPGSGFGYDAAGNMTSDPTYSYSYDAENRIVAVNGGSVASYVYDAEGRRVRKTSSAGTVDYLYDLSGHVITELSSSGGWNRGEIYAGSMHLATYDNGTTYFTHSDWLGNERIRSTVNGGVYSLWSNLPFGEGSSSSNPGPTHFTGKERDSESGLDNFGLRYNSSTMGRFMSPDPDAEAGFMHMDDPQAWNGYAYARNNPLKYTDPDGDNYHVCDEHGQNCSDQSDADFDKNKKAAQQNGEVWQDGKIYLPDQDGNLQLKGTYAQTDVDLPGDAASNRAAAGMIGFGGEAFINAFMYRSIRDGVTGGVLGVAAGEFLGGLAEGLSGAKAAAGAAGAGAAAAKAPLTGHAAVRAAQRGISQAMVDEAVTSAEQTGAISSRVGQYGTIQHTYHGTNGVSVVVETEGANAGKAITVYRTGSKP